jgi:Ca2+-binding RTX toxin-like protein
LGPDEDLLAQACSEANLQAFSCPASSHIGTATLTSRLFPTPLSAPIFIVQSTPLPGLAVDLRGAGIPAILRGTNELAGGTRLRNVFGPLPDLPLSRFALAFDGGDGGALITNERLCRGNRQFNASFQAHSGAQHAVQGAAQLNGHCPPRARPKCDGVRATIIGNGRANRLFGTGRRDVIVSKGGSDTIRSKAGNDIVCTGAGSDKAFLGKGKDKAFGGKGKDTLRGEAGNDQLNGGDANDTCVGGAGRDRLRSC